MIGVSDDGNPDATDISDVQSTQSKVNKIKVNENKVYKNKTDEKYENSDKKILYIAKAGAKNISKFQQSLHLAAGGLYEVMLFQYMVVIEICLQWSDVSNSLSPPNVSLSSMACPQWSSRFQRRNINFILYIEYIFW